MATSSSTVLAPPSLQPIPEDEPFICFTPNADVDADLNAGADADIVLSSNKSNMPWTSSRISPSHLPLPSWMCSSAPCDVRPSSRSFRCCRAVQRSCWRLMAILYVCVWVSHNHCVLGSIEVFAQSLPFRLAHILISQPPSSGLLSLFALTWNLLRTFVADSRDAAIFPNQLPSLYSSWMTHGVIPIPCHSHNDYWRRVPLYSALRAGCISVEADIWLEADELRVGHTARTLLLGHSLRSLYLNPLREILRHHNPASVNRSRSFQPGDKDVVGVFSSDPAQTLVLLIDFKSEGDSIWPRLVQQLQPLREGGFLSYFNGSTVISRPITVVASGNAPLHRILENTTYRDIFYDAPLGDLTHTVETAAGESLEVKDPIYNVQNSYYASVDFRTAIGSLPLGRLSQDQLVRLRSQVQDAHKQGLKVRYWGTPNWPAGLRKYVWRALVRDGVDIINVDDLHGATRLDWKSRTRWS
ncbi:uncharacterized protein N7459_000793 [Penicillium hispanicum]|uniref:uncharacterized protein n=1 Tax=Penicillium hispanicum TaxID=1080232 RepID=UPI0025400162|nr:uncharacterized protein N7459_000793 [Penicillium hispanicum]KAJ5594585.1 hypothetical protein N7459_000793 [Penicillium hispanicum]